MFVGSAPATRAYSLFTTIYTCPCQRERVTSPLESRDSLRLGADGPRPLRTGDGRHGRGCERCRCSDRPTARPCAAQGASRRRTNHEISAPRLLFGWGAVPGSRRQFSTPSLCGISPGTGPRSPFKAESQIRPLITNRVLFCAGSTGRSGVETQWPGASAREPDPLHPETHSVDR